MVGCKGWLAGAAASVFVVGSLVMFASGAQASSSRQRSEADTAAHGAAVSRPMMGMGGGGAASTGATGGATTGGSMSSGAMSSGGGAMAASGPAMTSKKDVMAAQRALNSAGAGLKVDGRMGPNTRRALMNYQAQNGMPVTGQLDSATASKLGV